jgi:hypothetical protein
MRYVAILFLLCAAACGGSDSSPASFDRSGIWQSCTMSSCDTGLACAAPLDSHCVLLAPQPNAAYPMGCPDGTVPMNTQTTVPLICTPTCTTRYEPAGCNPFSAGCNLVGDCPNGMGCSGGICFPPR